MHHLAGAVPVREVEQDEVDARQRVVERERRDGVRPVADPDEQRLLVEPHRVAALDGRGQVDPRRDRHARRLERPGGGLRLPAAAFLPRLEQHGAVATDEGGVVGVDRVGVARVVLGDDDLGARLLEQEAERLVLRLRGGDVRARPPARRPPTRRRRPAGAGARARGGGRRSWRRCRRRSRANEANPRRSPAGDLRAARRAEPRRTASPSRRACPASRCRDAA